MSDDLPPEIMIPGRRLLVVDDLGHVRKGDHVILVANVIIAVDTSRRPDDLVHRRVIETIGAYKSAPAKHRPRAQSAPYSAEIEEAMQAITDERVIEQIRLHEPIDSVTLINHLKIPANLVPPRDKVKRLLIKLTETGQIKRALKPNHKRLLEYRLHKARGNKTVISGDAFAVDLENNNK